MFHARRGTHDVLEVGFATLRAHDLVAIDRCPVLAPGLNGAIEAAWAIAEALGLSQRTVESYLQDAYDKLGLSNRTELAAALGMSTGTPAELNQALR